MTQAALLGLWLCIAVTLVGQATEARVNLMPNDEVSSDAKPFKAGISDYGEANGATGREKWSYVNVRPGAHMFWWLYYSTHPSGYQNRPTVIWLQGGPGAGSTGFGNFELIGPLDVNLNPRETTWVQTANVLFVDNPVGAGFSYVDNNNYLATDVEEISSDLMIMLRVFLRDNPEFQTSPIYIFGESYGGKMGIVFAEQLHREIQTGVVKAQLAGVALGDAWISPVDSTMTWGPLLHWMSAVDDVGLEAIQAEAQKAKDAVEAGRWHDATDYWRSTEYVVWDHTNYIDFYNILNYMTFNQRDNRTDIMRNYNPFLRRSPRDPMEDIMNSVIRDKLGIIPWHVNYDGQSNAVFTANEVDFMKHVLLYVEEILNNTNIDVIVYQGQLDLICDTKGAIDWVNRLRWPGKSGYDRAAHLALVDPRTGQTETYVKAHEQFKFYWNLRAGHAVPGDVGEAALRMLDRILEQRDT